MKVFTRLINPSPPAAAVIKVCLQIWTFSSVWTNPLTSRNISAESESQLDNFSPGRTIFIKPYLMVKMSLSATQCPCKTLLNIKLSLASLKSARSLILIKQKIYKNSPPVSRWNLVCESSSSGGNKNRIPIFVTTNCLYVLELCWSRLKNETKILYKTFYKTVLIDWQFHVVFFT